MSKNTTTPLQNCACISKIARYSLRLNYVNNPINAKHPPQTVTSPSGCLFSSGEWASAGFILLLHRIP